MSRDSWTEQGKPLSPTGVAVLKAVAGGTRYGFDIMDTTGLPSGTVYPVLGRLERQKLVRSRWESTVRAQREKRPARRYYETTAAGERALALSIEHYRLLIGGAAAPGSPVPKPEGR